MTASAHEILITIDEPFLALVAEESLRQLALGVLREESKHEAELDVYITGDETVRRLNREYAGDDHATDVLSFSLREGDEFVSPAGSAQLGEVIISYETAKRQADEAGRGVDDEIAHLLVHGILHLLGYDHANPGDEQRMRAREEAFLGGDSRHHDL
jgi:probable rRNA maturation factor